MWFESFRQASHASGRRHHQLSRSRSSNSNNFVQPLPGCIGKHCTSARCCCRATPTGIGRAAKPDGPSAAYVSYHHSASGSVMILLLGMLLSHSLIVLAFSIGFCRHRGSRERCSTSCIGASEPRTRWCTSRAADQTAAYANNSPMPIVPIWRSAVD